MKFMRKALMTAAISCAMFGTAFADGEGVNTHQGQFDVQFADFIILIPNGTWPQSQDPFQVFTNDNLNLIHETPTETFNVTASRSWKVRIYASTFDRDPAPAVGSGVGDHIDPAAIYQVQSTNGDPGVDVFAWQAIPMTAPGAIVAQSATGGVTKHFTLQGRIIPNLGLNMSGLYHSTVHIIASLD
jgi:hypothetical protein